MSSIRTYWLEGPIAYYYLVLAPESGDPLFLAGDLRARSLEDLRKEYMKHLELDGYRWTRGPMSPYGKAYLENPEAPYRYRVDISEGEPMWKATSRPLGLSSGLQPSPKQALKDLTWMVQFHLTICLDTLQGLAHA